MRIMEVISVPHTRSSLMKITETRTLAISRNDLLRDRLLLQQTTLRLDHSQTVLTLSNASPMHIHKREDHELMKTACHSLMVRFRTLLSTAIRFCRAPKCKVLKISKIHLIRRIKATISHKPREIAFQAVLKVAPIGCRS